jgi:hypothetical protein
MRFHLAVASVLLLVGGLAAGSAAQLPAEVPARPELFGLTRVLQVELRLTAEAWEQMQPTGPPQFGPAPTGRPGAKKKPGAHRTVLGMEYPIVHATLKLGETNYPDVALRFKGNFTYMASSRGFNRPFRVDLSRFVKGRTLDGVSKFSLNNNVTDPSRLREALAYHVFREAKVAAPRTGFARVYLTVPGKSEHRYLGLYTLVEAVDERFLKAQFGTDAGLLLKPQGQSLSYLGEGWSAYAARFGDTLKGEAPAASTVRYIALARLVSQRDETAFRRGITELLDVDQFLRFLAANVLLVNLDSFLVMGQNYYLYHVPASDPDKSRFAWVPWDLDLAFGAWPMGGSPEQQADLSLLHPYGGENPLIQRVLGVPEYRAAYLALVKELVHGPFSVPHLNAQLDASQPVIRAAVTEEGPVALAAFDRATGTSTEVMHSGGGASGQPGDGFPQGMPSLPLRSFIRQRVQSVNSQLAGTRPGYLVQVGPGRGGGPGRGPAGGGGPGQVLGPPLFGTADRDQNGRVTAAELSGMLARWSAEWDADRNASLSPLELVRGLNLLFGLPPGDPRGGGGPGQPQFGGPGGFLGPQLFRVFDTTRDGRATAAELAAAAREWLREWDRDRNGVLTPEEFIPGLSTLLGPPPSP